MREQDAADQHVARWRDHWVDIPFDDEVEGLTTRLVLLVRFLRSTKQRALMQTDLQEHEYDTLHSLMIRETPGRSTPGELAHDLGVSPAGMTGRLNALEHRGFVTRISDTDDRRRVDVEITDDGTRVWRRTMSLRGHAEDDLAAGLSREELGTLNALLRRLVLRTELGAQQG